MICNEVKIHWQTHTGIYDIKRLQQEIDFGCSKFFTNYQVKIAKFKSCIRFYNRKLYASMIFGNVLKTFLYCNKAKQYSHWTTYLAAKLRQWEAYFENLYSTKKQDIEKVEMHLKTRFRFAE